MTEIKVGGRFLIGKKLGSGSFGDIYLGTDVQTKLEVAVKIEPANSRHPQLAYEYRIYRSLQKQPGIPKVYWFGREGGFHALVIDLLGPSLEELFNYCGRHFSLKTILMITDQLLTRLEYIHSKNFMHRDVKPANFLVGTKENDHHIYVIDFGLSKRYRDRKTMIHIPYNEKKSLTGTARYASINTHKGIEQSRRDDLESLGFVLMYFNRGKLPWQGLRAKTKKEKYVKIMEKKITTPISLLCKDFPNEFATYLKYCRSLRFVVDPDYEYLRGIFRELFDRSGFEMDGQYDWVIKSRNASRLKRSPSNYHDRAAHVARRRSTREAEVRKKKAKDSEMLLDSRGLIRPEGLPPQRQRQRDRERLTREQMRDRLQEQHRDRLTRYREQHNHRYREPYRDRNRELPPNVNPKVQRSKMKKAPIWNRALHHDIDAARDAFSRLSTDRRV